MFRLLLIWGLIEHFTMPSFGQPTGGGSGAPEPPEITLLP